MAKPDISVHTNIAPRPGTLLGLRVREDVLFTKPNGEEHSGTQKRVQKILDKLAPTLQRIVTGDETVLYVANARAPISLFEQWGLGWYVYQITATVLVFTNRRVIHLLVDTKGKWRGHWKTVAYGDLTSVETKGFLGAILWLKYRNGKKEKYWGLRRADAKKIKAIADAALPASTAESTAAQGMVSLCPECMATLTERVYHCNGCGLIFKDESTMKKRSWIIPGGGYFYCKQTLLGVLDFMAEAWLTLLVLLFAFLAYSSWGEAAPKNPDDIDPTGALVLAGIFAAALIFEKLLTVHHCKRFIHEYISTGQKDPMRMQSAGMSAGKIG